MAFLHIFAFIIWLFYWALQDSANLHTDKIKIK